MSIKDSIHINKFLAILAPQINQKTITKWQYLS